MHYTVVIAEDDVSFRKYLKSLIDEIPEFEVVGEAKNGRGLIQLVEKVRPHIAFIDVQMPEMDGMEAAQEIMDINPLTILIFTTSYNKYMAEAFEVYAFDYITKPLDEKRVYNTLARVKLIQEQKRKDMDSTDISYRDDKLLLQCEDGLAIIYKNEIIFICREDRKTVFYTTNGRYMASEPLQEIEEKLDENIFLRTHRSYIVNATMVSRLIRWTKKSYTILFRHIAEEAMLTSDKLEELKSKMDVVN